MGLSTVKIFLATLLFLMPALILSQSSAKPQQFTPEKLAQSLKTNKFTLVYFYSTTCQYCQAFSPKFEQLAKIHNIEGLVLGKIDGPNYKEVIEKYDVFAYPSILLFWKDIDMPIVYRKEREVAELLSFLKKNTQVINQTLTKSQLQKMSKARKASSVIYYGPPRSDHELAVMSVLSYIEPYHPVWIHHANVSQSWVEIAQGEPVYDFDIHKLRTQVRTAFAKLFQIQQEPWLRLFEQKELGLVYVHTNNKNQSDVKRVTQLLNRLSKEYPDMPFMMIQPSMDQYKDALSSLGVENEDQLYSVHQRYTARFVASKPYTEQSIREFIKQSVNLSAPLYMRSEKTNHKQKLTLQNFKQKLVDEPKDVLLFLYKDEDRLQAKFMDLFKFLTNKLQNNKNISLLRCNLSKNQIEGKLEFQVKITPMIVFYGHRMKDKPVHFVNSVISAQNVIEFIMENTTFDWEDEWGEL